MTDKSYTWITASLDAAKSYQKGPAAAAKLRAWSRAFMEDPDNLPYNPYGQWNKSSLEQEGLAQDIKDHRR